MKKSILYEEDLLGELKKPIARLNLEELSEEEKKDMLDKVVSSIMGRVEGLDFMTNLNGVNEALIFLHFVDLTYHLWDLHCIPHSDSKSSDRTKKVLEAKSILYHELIKAKDLDKAIEVLELFDNYKAPKRLDFIKPILVELDLALQSENVSKRNINALKTRLKEHYLLNIANFS